MSEANTNLSISSRWTVVCSSHWFSGFRGGRIPWRACQSPDAGPCPQNSWISRSRVGPEALQFSQVPGDEDVVGLGAILGEPRLFAELPFSEKVLSKLPRSLGGGVVECSRTKHRHVKFLPIWRDSEISGKKWSLFFFFLRKHLGNTYMHESGNLLFVSRLGQPVDLSLISISWKLYYQDRKFSHQVAKQPPLWLKPLWGTTQLREMPFSSCFP